MTITTIPQQNEGAGQLGKSKVDGAGVYDADTKIKAAQWNQNVLRLIELFNEVGLSDGSTAGSINARLLSLYTDSDFASWFDDFTETPGGWRVEAEGDGSAGTISSGTAGIGPGTSFPSRGVAGMFIQPDAVGGSKVNMYQPGLALMFSDAKPMTIGFRATRPFSMTDFTIEPQPSMGTAGGVFSLGCVGGFGEDGPSVGIVISAGVDGDNHRVWSVNVIDGDPEAPTVTAFDMPTCSWFDARITAGVDGWSLEIAPDGGAFSEVASSGTAIPDGVYVPFLFGQTAAGGGQGLVLDMVSGSGVRDTTHAGTPGEGLDWPDYTTENKVQDLIDTSIGALSIPGPSGSTPQAVGTTGSAGSDGDYSKADHVHTLSEGAARQALAALTADPSFNSHKLTGVADGTSSNHAATKGQLDAVQSPASITSSTAISLSASHNGKTLWMTNPADCSIFVNDGLPDGFTCQIVNATGSGSVSFDGDPTMHVPDGFTSSLSIPYGTVAILYKAGSPNEFVLSGMLDAL